MQPSPFWQRLIDPYRAGDWDECIRRARRAVDAEPFEPSPRQLLARLYGRVDHPRLALLHYEKLLPIAVGRGDLLRALAVQRQIDALLPPGSQATGRYEAMQRWFRMVGRSLGIPSDPADAVGFTPGTLLSLPPDAFEAMALEMGVDVLDLAPHETSTEGGSVRVIVMGRVRWSLALPEQSFGDAAIADEGACVRIDPGQVKRAVLRLEPEVPSECLRFDASLMTKLSGWSPGITASVANGGKRQPSAPARSRRVEVIHEEPKSPSAPLGTAPPRIRPGAPPPPDKNLAAALNAMDFSTIDLNAPVSPRTFQDEAASQLLEQREFELSELDAPAGPSRPVPESKRAAEPENPPTDPTDRPLRDPRDPLVEPVEPTAPAGSSIERRRHMRVMVALGSRIALVGMRDRSFEASVIDLSDSGLALSLDLEAVGGVLRALDGSVIRLELQLPPDGRRHDLAGRVRSVAPGPEGTSARVGVEFVMLTDADRAAIRLAVSRVSEGRPPLAA